MPRPDNLTPLEITFSRGYWPSAADIPPIDFLGTIRAGSNVLLRSTGKIEVAKGLSEVSSTNVGARIFAANTDRVTIAGGLSGSQVPYAGLFRYQNSVLFFLSQDTSAQLYVNESAASGVTTSATAGLLRIAIPDGGGGYTTVDAGFDKPSIPSTTVTTSAGETRTMSGTIGIAVAAWRSKTQAIGPPSETVYNSITPATGTVIRYTLGSVVSGQDGWAYLGTRWNDQGGELRVVRYVYKQPRGTFTATNGSANLTAGVGTFWTQDLRPGDIVTIDGGTYTINSVTSNTTAVLTGNFTGSTNSGKTMIITDVAGAWTNRELGRIVSRDTFRAPRAAGVTQYGGRVLVWGIPDTQSVASSLVTGNSIQPTLANNPEHVGLFAIVTDSGSDLVNVLGGNGPLYLMTTTGLEVVNLTSDPANPYTIRIVSEPGFKATTNGVLYGNIFYGFSNRPLRTQINGDIDHEFAEAPWSDMQTWDAQRVIVAVDPVNEAVVYIYDNGSTSVAIPYMAQLGWWGPPLNFSARIIDAAVVNGSLYVTYLSGGNYRVNRWEGGTGIGGTRYVASQYYDPRLLERSRVKRLRFSGKAGTLRVYAASEDVAIPDVSDTAAAAATFTLSDVDKLEPEIHTNIHGNGFAFRVDFSSNDGKLTKLVAAGTPIDG